MYLYADESGDPGYRQDDPEFKKEGAEPFLVFCIFLIEDKRAKYKIQRIIKQTVTDLRNHYEKQHGGHIPKKLRRGRLWPGVLKEHPEIRLRLFERIMKPEIKCHIYTALFDKRKLKQMLPKAEGRRYALLFRNVFLESYSLSKNQRFVPLIVDKRYENKEERKRFDSMVLRVFIRERKAARKATIDGKIKQKKTILWVFHAESLTNELPLQIADIIANFGHKKLELDEPLPLNHLLPNERERKKQEREKERTEWEKAFKVLEPKMTWRTPKRFKAGV